MGGPNQQYPRSGVGLSKEINLLNVWQIKYGKSGICDCICTKQIMNSAPYSIENIAFSQSLQLFQSTKESKRIDVASSPFNR